MTLTFKMKKIDIDELDQSWAATGGGCICPPTRPPYIFKITINFDDFKAGIDTNLSNCKSFAAFLSTN